MANRDYSKLGFSKTVARVGKTTKIAGKTEGVTPSAEVPVKTKSGRKRTTRRPRARTTRVSLQG